MRHSHDGEEPAEEESDQSLMRPSREVVSSKGEVGEGEKEREVMAAECGESIRVVSVKL